MDAIKMVKSSKDPSKSYYQFLQEFIESEGMKDVTVEDLGKLFYTLTRQIMFLSNMFIMR